MSNGSMEVDRNELLINSKGADHVKDLKIAFKQCPNYVIRGNPIKCSFKVIIGEFFGFYGAS